MFQISKCSLEKSGRKKAIVLEISNRDRILQALITADDFVSGEALSSSLQVSRTSIWKQINNLRQEGFIIESVTHKGYRLVERPRETLSETLLRRELRALDIQSISVIDTVDSTNQALKREAEHLKGQALLIAGEQTGGKGRRGRKWESPDKGGIYMSLLLRPNILPQESSMITLIAGLAMTETLIELTGLDIGIKWPNDVVVNKKKVCGILTELNAEIGFLNYVVLGVGLNYRRMTLSEELKDKAIAIEEAMDGQHTMRQWSSVTSEAIVVGFVQRFMKELKVFEQTRSLAFLKERYESLSMSINQPLRIQESEGWFQARGIGITDTGALIIEEESGNRRHIESGEVSVRGLYGYVND